MGNASVTGSTLPFEFAATINLVERPRELFLPVSLDLFDGIRNSGSMLLLPQLELFQRLWL